MAELKQSTSTTETWWRKINLTTAILTAAIITVIAGITWRFWPRVSGNDLVSYLRSLPDHSRIKTQIAGRDFTLEVVNTPTSIQQGLSDRGEIGSDGMIFVMDAKAKHPFWMPRMHFDLDILWCDDTTIKQISANVPAPDPSTPLVQLPIYYSDYPINLIIEIPAGRAALTGIKAGDELHFVAVGN